MHRDPLPGLEGLYPGYPAIAAFLIERTETRSPGLLRTALPLILAVGGFAGIVAVSALYSASPWYWVMLGIGLGLAGAGTALAAVQIGQASSARQEWHLVVSKHLAAAPPDLLDRVERAAMNRMGIMLTGIAVREHRELSTSLGPIIKSLLEAADATLERMMLCGVVLARPGRAEEGTQEEFEALGTAMEKAAAEAKRLLEGVEEDFSGEELRFRLERSVQELRHRNDAAAELGQSRLPGS